MKTLEARLADALETDGWELVRRHVDDLDWWADELWELKSRWSPVDTPAFITFLVDLQWEGNRRKGEGVWALGCSSRYPGNHMDAADAGYLRRKASRDEIEQFVAAVNAFRNSRGH